MRSGKLTDTVPDDEEDPYLSSDDEKDGIDLNTTADDAATNPDDDDVSQLTASDNAIIRSLKLVFTVLILGVTVGLALSVYFHNKHHETQEFHTAFEQDVTQVLDSLALELCEALDELDSMAVAILSLTAATGQEWPQIVIPDFARRAANMRRPVALHPLVASDQQNQWEAFSAMQNDWVDETLMYDAVMGNDGFTEYRNINLIYEDTSANNNDFQESTRTGPFLPQWQSYPLQNPPYNWDLLSIMENEIAVTRMDSENRVVLTQQALPPNNSDNSTVPRSEMFYPLFPGSLTQNDFSSLELAGLLAMTLDWGELLENALPTGSDGIRLVFESECRNQTFTYQVNGPEVEFLGMGDAHESKYQDLEVQMNVMQLPELVEDDSRRYTGIPVDTEFCAIMIRAYPSSTMESAHTTNNAAIFAVTAGVAFTCLVFAIYVCFLERRQRKLMKAARRSSAIVSSLFPSVVRDRMFTEDKPRPKSINLANNGEITAVKEPNRVEASMTQDDNSSSKADSEQIADLYPDATVLFADLAGFTKWSSTREPCQVFSLLETLYGAFDEIADKRKVFKVETIGDCYVATTGLPQAQKDHATRMAKFAADCRDKMLFLTKELEMTLGKGTEDLALRVGLHSGPVTAGVLRGQKARFQLFGDTVNTAARMESNGRPNMIHVSQQTADLIVKAGKSYWLTQRAQMIEAKGKGKLQTYWVDPRRPPEEGHGGIMKEFLNLGNTNEIAVEQVDDWSNLLICWKGW